MRMRVRLVVPAMAAAAAVLAAGCGASGSSGTGGGSASTTVKIGVPLSLSGPVAFAGVQMQKAMKLAFADANAKMKASGVTLEPIYVDDKSDQPTAIDVTQRLAQQDQVAAITGYTAGNICQAALPVAQKLKVPSINADCVTPKLVQIGDYIFRTAQPLDPALRLMVQSLAPKLGLKTAASITLQENPSTVNIGQVMGAALSAAGVNGVDKESVQSGTTANFASELTRIASKHPDALVVSVLGGQAGQVMVQARQNGLNAPLLGEQNLGSSTVTQVAGAAAANTYFSTYWNPLGGSAANKAFIQAFRASYKAQPDTFAANGYAAVQVIAQAVEKAGKPSGDIQAYRDKLKSILANLGKVDSIMGTGSLTMANRAAHMDAVVVHLVRNGKSVKPEIVQQLPAGKVFAGGDGDA